MFEELSIETLANVTGGGGVDPTIAGVLLLMFEQSRSARSARLASLGDRIGQLATLVGPQSEASVTTTPPPAALPVGPALPVTIAQPTI